MVARNAWRYSIRLKTPLRWKGIDLSHREGVLLQECVEGQADRWAEAAPLPGFSVDTLADVLEVLPAWVAGENGDSSSLPPSMAWALRCLADPEPVGEIEIPTAALLSGDPGEVLARCMELNGSFCTAAKLKIGKDEPEADAALVRGVRSALGPEIELRLDVNRAWTFDQARIFEAALGDVDIAFIEEPVRDAALLRRFDAETRLPLALDESLLDEGGVSLDGWQNLCALVLKPTLLGGALDGWLAQGEAAGLRTVFSAAFETGVGLAHIARCADPACPAGLDTWRWLSTDVLADPLEFAEDGVTVPASLTVLPDQLTPLVF